MVGARKLITAAAIAAATTLAACGDDEPEPSIPFENAQTLVATLDEVRDNVDVGSCTVATGKVQEFEDELNDLPSDVDDEVRDGLQRAALNLGRLVEEECDQDEPEEPTTTEETEPTETTEETEPTEPTEETEPTEPTDTGTTTTPPGGGGGSGGLGPSGGNP
jgi:hypothetical protein